MEGWTDGWRDGWREGLLDGHLDGGMDGWIDGEMWDGQLDGGGWRWMEDDGDGWMKVEEGGWRKMEVGGDGRGGMVGGWMKTMDGEGCGQTDGEGSWLAGKDGWMKDAWTAQQPTGWTPAAPPRVTALPQGRGSPQPRPILPWPRPHGDKGEGSPSCPALDMALRGHFVPVESWRGQGDHQGGTWEHWGGGQWELGALGRVLTGFVVDNWELVAQLVAGAVLTTGVGISFGTSKP